MKRVATFVLLCVLFTSSFAYAGVVDSFGFLRQKAGYAELIRQIRGNGDARKADVLRKGLVSLTDPDLSEEQNLVATIRASLAYGRLLVKDGPVLNKREGQDVVREALGLIDRLPDDSFYRLALTADAYSLLYLSDTGDLSNGIESQKALSKAYRKYPDEFYSIYLKANNLVFAPVLFGGNVSKGLDMLLDLYKKAGSEVAPWDLASLCGVIGIACYKTKAYDKAREYLESANRMYPVDSEIKEYLAKVEAT
jgi:tetratricopeptide (TPR) repeat protein